MPTVMVVDDDPEVLAITSDVLALDGHRIVTASSGEMALDLLEREQEVDLLLTDVVMGAMNGFELAARARLARAGLRVLFMSGFYRTMPSVPEDIEHGKLLRKPWRADELKMEVRNLLGM